MQGYVNYSTFKSTDIVSPELSLLCERNIASVEVERHRGVLGRGGSDKQNIGTFLQVQ